MANRALVQWILIASTWVSLAEAQLPQARLNSIHPLGGQRGTTFELTLTGPQDLDECSGIVFSHPGITATPKKVMADGKEEVVPNVFMVTVAGDVPLGVHDIRAIGLFGISNPRSFEIGQWKDVAEIEPNNTRDKGQVLELNQSINGESNTGADVDLYKFTAKGGQRVLFLCNSFSLDSTFEPTMLLLNSTGKQLKSLRTSGRDLVLDYVFPADGDYYIRVSDLVYKGAAGVSYRLTASQAPRIEFVVPASGLPGTSSEFTLYGRNLPGGQPSPYQMGGVTLEQLRVGIAIPAGDSTGKSRLNVDSTVSSIDSFDYALGSPTGESNPVRIHLATAPTSIELEPNNPKDKPQVLTVPTEVTGQLATRADQDVYEFQAKAQEAYFVEIYGDRMERGVDSVVSIDKVNVNEQGEVSLQRLANLDDNPLSLNPLLPLSFDTRSKDASFRLDIPADGVYRVTVRDRFYESLGSPNMVYRLAIRKPAPDYRLVAVPTFQNPQTNSASPWAITLRKGDNVGVEVLAHRFDGFNETIEISVEGLPAGVTANPIVIGPNRTNSTLVFSSAADAPDVITEVKIIGKSKVMVGDQAQELVRESRYGTVVIDQGNGAVSIARLSRSLPIAVNSEVAPYQVMIEGEKRFEVGQSSQIVIPFKLQKRDGFNAQVNLNFVNPPPNGQVENKPIAQDTDAVLSRVFLPPNTPPGAYTLMVNGQGQISYRRNPKAAEAAAKEKDASIVKANEVAEALKKAQETKTTAEKKATDTAAALKVAEENLVNADKAAMDAKAATDAAVIEQQKADQAVKDADTVAKDTDTKAKQAKEAADKDTNNKDLADAAVNAAKAAETAAAQLKTAQDNKAAADKKVTEAAELQKKADEAKVIADKEVTTNKDLVKVATEEKAVADKGVVDAESANTQAQAAKAVAEKKAQDTANIANPQNLNFNPPSPPIVVIVKQGSVTLTAEVPNGGNIKRGEKIEVKVTVNRINNFAGAVDLSLPLPPGVVGLTADALNIPADQKEGMFMITAGGDATEGQLPYMVVRATTDFNGKTTVDQPINLTVNK